MTIDPGGGAGLASPVGEGADPLRESEAWYRAHAEGAASIAWSTPPLGEFTAPQPEWSAFTGQSFEQMRGRGWIEAIHPHDRARTLSAWERARAGLSPYAVEHRVRRHDGEYRWMQARAIPLVDEVGAVREWVGAHTDVTDRRLAEQALRRGEEQLRHALDSIAQMVWITRPDGAVEYYNRRWYEYTGLTLEEARGDGARRVTHPDDRARAAARWLQSLATGEPYSVELRVRRHDGEYRWFLGQALAQRDDAGAIVRWFGTSTDIEAQKRAEAERDRLIGEVEAERARLREVLTQAPALILLLRGPEHRVELANTAYRALAGGRTLEGMPVREALPEVEGQGLFELLDGVYASGRAVGGEEKRVLIDRGAGVPPEGFFNFVYQPIRGVDGEVDGILVQAVEVTAQVRARQAVERLEERLRLALESADVGTWDMDVAGGGLAWDARCREIFGLGPGDAVDYPSFLDRLYPEDRPRVDAAVRRGLDPAGSGEFQLEYRLVQPSGAVRWAQARGRAFFQKRDGARAAVRFTGTVIDATDAKRVEEERERAVTARSRFYAAMSHELRTPINAVLGYNDLLLAGVYGELSAPQQTSLERGQRAARHLLYLVNDVLDLSKLEAGKMELVWEPVPVVPLVQDLFATVQPLADANGSELRLEGREAAGVEIVTDPRRVQQILLNLISNALKFGQGKPVEVRCAATAHEVTIEVADRGVGIPPDDLARIFEEFIQLPNANAGGTGLGLPISQRLARLLGGRLEVESAPGAGSTFHLRLPRRAVLGEGDVPDADV
jgi:PAS domain S-box-containing protein